MGNDFGRVYDFLLLAHILAAFALFAMVVMYTAFVLGGPTPRPAVILAQTLDGIGGLGTLIFGVWLALYLDGYELWDGWIIAALVLWAVAAEMGRRTHTALEPSFAGGSGAEVGRRGSSRREVARDPHGSHRAAPRGHDLQAGLMK